MQIQRKTARSLRALTTTLGLFVAVVCSAEVQAAAAVEPRIELTPTQVVIGDITRGGTAVVFGAAQEIGVTVQLTRWQRALADEDGDGIVTLDLEHPMPADAVWVAVDLTTGQRAVALPEGSRFRRIDFPQEVLSKGAQGKVDRYVTGRKMADVVVVRPRVGAWASFAADGRAGDGDGQYDGRTTISFDRARSMKGRVPAPQHLTPRDVVVSIDLRNLQYYMTEVAE